MSSFSDSAGSPNSAAEGARPQPMTDPPAVASDRSGDFGSRRPFRLATSSRRMSSARITGSLSASDDISIAHATSGPSHARPGAGGTLAEPAPSNAYLGALS